MRMIGHLESEMAARTISDYLYANGIENQVEADRDGTWALWIDDEDQLATARTFFEEYRTDRSNPKFAAAGREAQEKRELETQKNKAAQRRTYDSSRLFPSGIGGIGRLTVFLVAVCALVALVSNFGKNLSHLQPLFITEFNISGQLIGWEKGLPEIRHGQVWRLVTPIFIHFGVVHLLFNMLWIVDLGTMVERRQGARLLALLIVVIAVPSNLAQYAMQAPNFGGMSGVVYGLIGYIWVRGKFDPASGLFLHSSTVTMAVVWYFLCLAQIIPHVANTVHTVGFAVGLSWGFVSAQIATRRLR
jgi:GlpG protein